MKRKIKLITSIASLTAAIALLVSGVWAAALRTVSVSGTVKFTAENVNATVLVNEGLGLTSAAATADLAATGTKVFKTATAAGEGTAADQANLAVTLLKCGDLKDDKLVYIYQFTVTNDSSTVPMYAKLTISNNTVAGISAPVVVTMNGASTVADLSNVTIAHGETVICTVTYTVNPDVAANQATFAIASSVELATSAFVGE